MKFKGLFAIMLALAMVLSLAACGGGDTGSTDAGANTDGGSSAEAAGTPASADEVKTIKFAHWFAEDHPQHKSMLYLKDILEERSNGTLKLEVYPNSQLGSEDVYDQSVSQGTVEMGCAGTNIQTFLPKIGVTEAPFLFNDWDDAEATLRGDAGAFVVDGLIEAGNMRCVAITVNGFREMSSNKSMYSMDELKSQKFRTPNIPHFVQMMECLGATSVPMAMSEIFNALETKVVDGQENPYPTIYTSSFYEVQKYVLESRHMFSPNFWIINEAFYQSMSDEQKKVFDECIKEAADYNWEISKDYDNEAKQAIADSGITEIIVPDAEFKKQMQDAMGPVYDWFYENKEGSEEFVKMVREYQASN